MKREWYAPMMEIVFENQINKEGKIEQQLVVNDKYNDMMNQLRNTETFSENQLQTLQSSVNSNEDLIIRYKEEIKLLSNDILDYKFNSDELKKLNDFVIETLSNFLNKEKDDIEKRRSSNFSLSLGLNRMNIDELYVIII